MLLRRPEAPLLLLSLALLASASSSSPSAFSPDIGPLLQFKSSSDHANALSSWSSASDPCSGSWVGVACRNGRVTRLVLRRMKLNGSVHSLLRLDQLRLLSLQGNALTTTATLDLSPLTNLKLLYLSYNLLSGSFPAGVASLRRLRRLDLSYNRFSGGIPAAELTRLPHLITLRLEENLFSGALPSLLLGTLADFNVSGNGLVGEIPSALSVFPRDCFQGNRGLCGSPLPSNCSRKSLDSDPLPLSVVSKKNHFRLRRNLVLIIILADVLPLCLILGLLVYCFHQRAKKKDLPPKTQVGSHHTGGNGGRGSGAEEEEMLFFEGCEGFRRVEDLLRGSAEMLGKGTVGTTYKVAVEGGQVVVVKRVRERRSAKEACPILMEAGGLRHPNLVALRAFYSSRDEMLLVSDFLSKGSLHFLLHGNRGPGRTPLGWPTRLKLAQGAAEGLAFLHDRAQMTHGHLHTSNILIDRNWTPHIADFGLHQLLHPSAPNKGYQAPELLSGSGNKFSQKSDVYSFGVLLLEILTGKVAGDGEDDLVKWVLGTSREEWAREVFDLELQGQKETEEEMVGLLQVAMLCLAKQPKDRPKMAVVQKMIEEIGARGSSRGAGRIIGGLSSPTNNLFSSDSSPALSDDTGPRVSSNRNLF